MRLLALIVAMFLACSGFAQALQVKEVEVGSQKLWFAENHSNPIISISIAFEGAGFAADPENKSGLASYVSGMLNEGAGEMTAEAFMQKLDENSIGFAPSVDADNFYVNVKTLSENLDVALELANLAITQPKFAQDSFSRVGEQMRTIIKKNSEDVDFVAGDAFNQSYFAGHAYAKSKDGSFESVAQIQPQDLHAFVRKNFAKDNLKIAIAGDVDVKTVQKIVRKLTENLQENASRVVLEKFSSYPNATNKYVQKDFDQTVILFALPAISRDDTNFYAAYLLNHIWGGEGFQSRLFNELREKRGLTYYSWSKIANLKSANVLFGAVGTQSAKKEESIRQISAEISRLANEPLSQAELDSARSYVVGSYLLNLDSSAAIAQHMLELQLDDLPVDYAQRRKDFFEKVSLADVNALAKKIFAPEKLYIVAVGK